MATIKVEVSANGFGGIRSSKSLSLTQNLNADGRFRRKFELDGWTVTLDGRSFICEYLTPGFVLGPKTFRRRFPLVPGTLELKQKKTVEARFKRGDLSVMMWREYGITETRRAEPGGRSFPVNLHSDHGPAHLEGIYCNSPLEFKAVSTDEWLPLTSSQQLSETDVVRITTPTGWAVVAARLDKTDEKCCILYTTMDESTLLLSIEEYLSRNQLSHF